MTDQRPESLAAQAASWVPPWERAPRPPDEEYAASQRVSADEDHDEPPTEAPAEATPADDDVASAEPVLSDDGVVASASADEEPDFEGANPAEGGTRTPEEFPGEPGVDAPQELPGEPEPEPTEVGGGPELPMPEAIVDAVEHEDDPSPTVDAPTADAVLEAAADDEAEIDPDPAGWGLDGVAEPAVAVAAVLSDAESADAGADGEPEAPARPSEIPAQGRRRKGDAAASEEPSRRTEKEEEVTPEPVPMEDGELRAALEAILLVVDEPVAELQLAQIVEQPAERVGAMLEDISARYTAAGHGFDLRRAAGGWRLYTRPEYAPYVERFVLDGQSVRLTQAALETLAVVAYKQPVTRSRISAIRGVNCDGVMRTLNTRGLIEECGTEGETGAFLYRTTALFLEKLGLNSVDQLPPLAPFLPDDVEEVLDASG